MKLLKTIKHEDIYDDVRIEGFKNIKKRDSVRIVLFDDEGKIAFYKYLPKEGFPEGEVGLPGGGVDAPVNCTTSGGAIFLKKK